ncbi:MAG: polysaccharide deacetylase family protein [Planctomycetota bacterium]|jgi:peptidoglycan/xylan/chitin deacetylase (PgdA/CDA1 family)
MQKLRAALSWLLYRLGVLHVLMWWQRRVQGQRLLVLSFHCLWDEREPESKYFRPGMRIEAADFNTILRVLRKHYDVVSMDEATGPDNAGRTRAVLTFDDGYKSVHRYAFPLMQAAGVTATVFLPTDFIGTPKLLWWDEVDRLVARGGDAVTALLGEAPSGAAASAAVERLKYQAAPERNAWIARLREAAGELGPDETLMDWDEVREMRAAGFAFENHTSSHRYLPDLGEDEMRADLQRAHDAIERELGYTSRHFAYPDGRPHREAGRILEGMGYRSGVSTLRRVNSDRTHPFFLRRVEASQDFRGLDGKPSEALIWAEFLGIWDALYLRRWRNRSDYSTPEEPRR